ncbi:MAG: TIGR03960 family B12-binding radical SAM protein [Nitrospiraceae bacterium]|nr:TIGR03960 family B12-binding radical SAM protein [Nitrospiraceae bacterium]
MNFLRFQKPSRYFDHEVNASPSGGGEKDKPVRVALAFPDVYEVGMSHLGLKILYHVINGLPFASCERVFHPWTDFEAHLRESGAPLSSLESGTPLRGFDVLGFSLQYELSYTSVLNMLSLSKIPLKWQDRTDEKNPFVIAGGPSTVNPAPLAPFMDAFLIGDGEEAVPEMLGLLNKWKREGDGRRQGFLSELAKLEGFYIPSVHDGGPHRVKRRYIASLEDAPYPDRPVVPYMQVVHDRVNIEVSRGCTMGCRFCQAGMIYRPLRERSPERVIGLAERALKSTGHEEVSFTSLSAGDYSCLLPLIRGFNRKFLDNKYAVSLPSLRVKALNSEVLKEIKSVRKTGFTIAPEAATERLRRVINKDFTDEDFDRALEMLFSEGWLNIKLYYMIGLPTETDEDVEAIPAMAMKALKTAKRHTRRFVNINVGVSSFVPKPHTPFQWCGQAPMEELARKKDFLRAALRKKGMNLKDHDPRMSLLEAAFARGDERLSELLLAAHRLGARLDGWSEVFDFSIWQKAMEQTGMDASVYALRTFAPGGPLPWGMIDPGVTEEYLIREYRKALEGVKTADCRTSCTGCGLKCGPGGPAGSSGAKKTQKEELSVQTGGTKKTLPEVLRVRMEFSKMSPLEGLSHRELMTAIARAARRAGLPLEYSKGFHPAPKIALGPPLGVGVKGLSEFMDMTLSSYVLPESVMRQMNAQLPQGIRVRSAAAIPAQAASLQSFISRYVYEIIGIGPDKGVLESFLKRETFPVLREGREIDLRKMVEDLEKTGANSVRMTLRDTGGASVRLEEAVREIFGARLQDIDVTRVALSGQTSSDIRPPDSRPQPPCGQSSAGHSSAGGETP